jgi:hypothetical protein
MNPYTKTLLTRHQVQEILNHHGWLTGEDTAWDPQTGEWVEETSFDDEIGIRDSYSLREVKVWLGY